MVRKWTVGATGFALLATTFVVVACSSKSDDDDSGNDAGKGGSTSMGGSAGKGGSSGSTTGGSSGTGTGGSTGGTTGGSSGSATMGGSAGTASGGMAGSAAGAAGAAPFSCSMPAMSTCNFISNWGVFATTSQFQGTYSYQEASIMVDKTTDPTKLHITGMVSNYDGFGIYTGKCSSLAGYTGVSFKLSGSTSSVDKPNALKFVMQINDDEPIDTKNMKGACPGAAGVDCVSPNKAVMPSDTVQTIMFSDLTAGKPLATADTAQVLGFQWQIDPDASKTPFAIDLTLSDFKLEGGGAPVDCSMGSGGMGGMGGMSGGAGAAGQAGMSGGQGGMAGMSGGQGGMSGQGGASGGRGGASGGRGGAGAGGRAN